MDPTELATAIKPLNKAASMPAGFYTDPAVFAAEREHILLKRWIFLAREDQLPAHGDYRCFDTVGGSVILLRDGDGAAGIRQLLPPPWLAALGRFGPDRPDRLPVPRVELPLERRSPRLPGHGSERRTSTGARAASSRCGWRRGRASSSSRSPTTPARPHRFARRHAGALRLAQTGRDALHLDHHAGTAVQLEAAPRERDGDVPHGRRASRLGRVTAVTDDRHPRRVEVHPGDIGPVDRHPAWRRCPRSPRSRASTTMPARARTSPCSIPRASSQLRRIACGGSMSPRSRTTTRGSRSGVASRQESSPHRTSRTRLSRTTTGGSSSAVRTSGSSSASSVRWARSLYRPGRLSWRDDQVQALSRWVLDHLPDAFEWKD